MPIDSRQFVRQLHDLREQKRKMQSEYEKAIKEIDRQIADEEEILARINEALEPLLCKKCNGSGEILNIDGAGSREHRTCPDCKGTGFAPD